MLLLSLIVLLILWELHTMYSELMRRPQFLTSPHSQPSHLVPLNLEITSFLCGCSFPVESTLCCLASLGIRVLVCVSPSRHTSLTEPDVPSFRHYQVIIDCQLVAVVCGHFPCFMLGVFSCGSFNRCSPCCLNCNEFIWAPALLCLWIFVYLKLSTIFDSYHLYSSLPKRSLSLWGVWYDSPF